MGYQKKGSRDISARRTLSVVMIVKNEAACLADCLASVKQITDELVVGDTGSTDNTRVIAEQFGAKTFVIPWHNDFAEARNHAMGIAVGDWILHLDADEVVDVESGRRIRQLVDADGHGADAVEVTLANYCDEPRAWRWVPVRPDDPMARGHAGYIGVALLRLFRNGLGFEYHEPIHENITESVLKRGGVIRTEPGVVIHHYGYSRGAKDRQKARLYLDIGRKKVAQRPHDPKAWHDLAEQLLACGEAAEAEAAARNAVALAPSHVGAVTALANILLNRGNLTEARELLQRLQASGCTLPHISTALGAIACTEGRLKEAQQHLHAALSVAPNHIMASLYLARVLDRLGDPATAEEQLARAITVAPKLKEPQDRLSAHRLRMKGDRLFQEGEHQQALEAFVSALRLDPEDPVAHNNLGVVLAALGETARARQSFQRALRLAPDMTEATDNLAAL